MRPLYQTLERMQGKKKKDFVLDNLSACKIDTYARSRRRAAYWRKPFLEKI